MRSEPASRIEVAEATRRIAARLVLLRERQDSPPIGDGGNMEASRVRGEVK
jgi:hypothetical protein